MLCTNCGATNADDARVCKSCNQPLSGVWQSPRSELVSAAVADGEMTYAGFWERLAALFLDTLVAIVLWLVGGMIFSIGVVAFARGNGALLHQSLPLMILGFYVGLFLIYGAYFVLQESGARGATLGKRALKLRVVDVEGNRISKGRALGRFFAHFLSNLMCIGYLIQPFTERKQALHDMVAGTLVVKTEKSNSTAAIIIAVIATFVVMLAIIGILAAVAIPAYQAYIAKANMMKAEAAGRIATQAVESYATQTGKIPASLADIGVKLPPVPGVEDVTVNPQDGEVQVVFSASMPPAVAGKALVFDASQGADGKIVWTCSGPGIPLKMLPADCR